MFGSPALAIIGRPPRSGAVFSRVIAVILIAGCNRTGGTLQHSVGRTGGHPTLSIGNQLLIFDGVDAPGPDIPLIGTGTVQVGGSGSAGGQSTFDKITINHSYEQGVQTITVGGTSLRLLENGRQLQLRNRTVQVHGKPETLHLAADGTVLGAK